MLKHSEGNKEVILRVDGSDRVGIGHIMRCIALAQGFEKFGIRSLFIVRDYGEEIAELIHRYGYDAEVVPKKGDFTDDASLTLKFAHQYSTRVIVVDMSNADTLVALDAYQCYLKALKKDGRFLIIIDGLDEDSVNAKIPIPSEIVIIPYLGAEKRIYKTVNGTSYLLGPAYFIFRQEFIKAAKVKREISRNVKNILVTMGGSDPLRLTTKIVKAILKLNRASLNLRIVTSPRFDTSSRQKLESILANFNGKHELLIEDYNMAELMLWSDLTITSSGLTKYETAVTATPSIIISYNDFHERIMDEFEEWGSALHLGQGKNVSEDDIAGAVNELSDNGVLRSQMSKKGRELVDGRGVERVISKIPKELLQCIKW